MFVKCMLLFANWYYNGYIKLCIVIDLHILSAGKEKAATIQDSHNSCNFHVKIIL